MKNILVLGGGFAGLWSAVGAARQLDKLGISTEEIGITLVNYDAYHSIRVRNYEPDTSAIRVPLDDILAPIGVKRVEGEILEIDCQKQSVTVTNGDNTLFLPYDRLVFALGSQLFRPNIPGLAEYAFSVDTYNEAIKLNAHLNTLPAQTDSPGRDTVLVVGAGLTGIEAAAEIPDKLRAAIERFSDRTEEIKQIRVILVDHSDNIGSDLGDDARPIIQEALATLNIETRTSVSVVALSASGVTLASGEFIAANTVIWTAGMRANPLTATFSVECDRWGRLPVDATMKVKGMENVFAAGDSAWTMIDDTHVSVMSCQHSRPMGRFAGHNVVRDLLAEPLLSLQIEWYVTVLDIGSWGAIYMEGWQRKVIATGETAKKTKQTINCQRIYPPLSGDRSEILAAAAPIVQSPPKKL
jgi:NADH:ubiquinone reductase (H+-translocating)